MIYEIASLPIKPDQTDSFQRAFAQVTHLLTRAKGYEGHRLMQGIEMPSCFSLIVRWQTLEHHTQDFEPGNDHEAFMTGLQEYFAADPVVYHVQMADTTNADNLFSL